MEWPKNGRNTSALKSARYIRIILTHESTGFTYKFSMVVLLYDALYSVFNVSSNSMTSGKMSDTAFPREFNKIVFNDELRSTL